MPLLYYFVNIGLYGVRKIWITILLFTVGFALVHGITPSISPPQKRGISIYKYMNTYFTFERGFFSRIYYIR